MLPTLRRRNIPGLFVTGTDTEVGKTVISAAIASWFARRGLRVGVSKPLASGCVKRREGLVSEDAEFLAAAADSAHPLDIICPVRYAEPLAPAIAAERADEPVDWPAIERSLNLITRDSDVLIVEGVGGIRVPLDPRATTLDLAVALALPVIVVARAGLGTINHTLLTVDSLRHAGLKVAGVVINAYPAEKASIAEESNPRAIEKWGKVPVLAVVPKADTPLRPQLTPDIHAAIETVDWTMLLRD